MSARQIISAVVESESTEYTLANGSVEWRDKDQRPHRIGGPAVKWPDGTAIWYFHGTRHRIGGPAFEYGDDFREYWVNDRHFTEDEYYQYVDQDTGEVFIPPGKKLKYDR